MLLIVMAILILISGVIRPATLKISHLVEIVRQSVPLGIAAVGQAAVILTGGIDLSVPATITMTNIIITRLMQGIESTTTLVVLLVLLIGAGIGAVNGYFISKFKVPPMVMTFAMSYLIRGGYMVFSGGTPKGSVSPSIRYIGSGRLYGIPFSVILYIAILFFIFVFILNSTRWGKSIYYIGNNKKAAIYSGIPYELRIILTYTFSSVMSIIAGLILSGYIGVASYNIGIGYDLDSIAAVVVSGITFTGIGSLVGAPIGALIITLVNSVLTSMGIFEPAKLITQGSIILIMVSLYGKGN